MSNEKKTLADVKPGGRVRLEDQAISTTELRRNAHVLVLQELRTRFTDAGSPSRTAALDAATSALSAQPSPGGQGDALKALDDLAAFCSDDAATVDRHVAVIRAALAARQPVGEPVGYRSRYIESDRVGIWMYHRERPMYESDVEVQSLYAAPPAQAVDLERFRPAVMTSLGLSHPNSTERETLRELLDVIDSQAVGNG